jgi:hypothetical protein
MRTSRSRNDGDAAAGEALAAALVYAGRGWPVFPCRGKRPHVKNGLHDAATDRLTVERWWTRIWPGANVAIRAGSESGLLVLDVDGEAGADALAALEREHAELGATVECLTGGGGRHLYFAHPGGELRNSAGRLAPGLDVRGDGGYVIAPPSRHSSGGRYEWSVDGHPDELEPAQAPAWLLEGLRARRNGTAPPVGEAIPEGARNAELASLAGTMRRRGMDEAAIRAALRETNRLRCRPPLDEGEVASIAASITRYRPQRGAPERTQQDVAAREAVPFALDVVSARELCALPDPPQSDELLGPMLVRGGRLVLGGGTGEGKTRWRWRSCAPSRSGANFSSGRVPAAARASSTPSRASRPLSAGYARRDSTAPSSWTTCACRTASRSTQTPPTSPPSRPSSRRVATASCSPTRSTSCIPATPTPNARRST